MLNENCNFTSLCAGQEDEIEMFQSDNLKDLIAFKWNEYGFYFHLFGIFIHMFYIVVLFYYVEITYVSAVKGDHDHMISFVILALIAYPVFYELLQICKLGLSDYFDDFGNFIDLIYLFSSIAT